MDMIVIAGLLGFFAVGAGYVVFCDRVVGAPPVGIRRQVGEADDG